jgi:lysophospholipase L1-like esterase
MAEENRLPYRKLRDGIEAWLSANKIPHVVPQVLPSELYADASHPLTEGYELLAARLAADEVFQGWAKRR